MFLKKNNVFALLLSLLLVLSTFIGVPINGGDKGWMWLNGVFKNFVAGNMQSYSLLHILLLISTAVLYFMPLCIGTRYRRKIIIVVPAVYLVLTVLTFPELIFLCIPFIVCWVLLMYFVLKNTKNQSLGQH